MPLIPSSPLRLLKTDTVSLNEATAINVSTTRTPSQQGKQTALNRLSLIDWRPINKAELQRGCQYQGAFCKVSISGFFFFLFLFQHDKAPSAHGEVAFIDCFLRYLRAVKTQSWHIIMLPVCTSNRRGPMWALVWLSPIFTLFLSKKTFVFFWWLNGPLCSEDSG